MLSMVAEQQLCLGMQDAGTWANFWVKSACSQCQLLSSWGSCVPSGPMYFTLFCPSQAGKMKAMSLHLQPLHLRYSL